MLAINNPSSKRSDATITPNVLPCRIHHDGPIAISSRYWNPIADLDNQVLSRVKLRLLNRPTDISTAYFRGRKLRGRRVPLPDGYQGVLVTQPDKNAEPANSENSNGQEEQNGADESTKQACVTMLETKGTFSDVVVWEHEKVPEADDAFVKGLSEWIEFAHAMHTDEDTQKQDK
ncbi:hypothetical protein FQN57_003408 [Myotisia sp. PD_48]|nr:hypothetical protein FQN57_003408 [Myotisia sp. PD_48]